MPISIVVADDHEAVRTGLASMFAGTDIRIVGEAKNDEEAVLLTLSRKPDVVLLDIRMGVDDGLATLKTIRTKLPGTRVVLLTTYDNPKFLARAEALGAADYILKGCSRQELVKAIKRAAAGESSSSESLLQRGQESTATPSEQYRDVTLTARELQVVSQVALGLGNIEIGRELGISKETVKEHVQNILRKIDGNDRTQAAVWAAKKGLV